MQAYKPLRRALLRNKAICAWRSYERRRISPVLLREKLANIRVAAMERGYQPIDEAREDWKPMRGADSTEG